MGCNKAVADIEGGCKGGNISEDIIQSSKGRSLITVLWDGIADVIDCIVWQFKFVAVCINEAPIAL